MLVATSHIANALVFGALAAGTVASLLGVAGGSTDALDADRTVNSRAVSATQAIQFLATPPTRVSDTPRVLSPSAPLLSVEAVPASPDHGASRSAPWTPNVMKSQRGAGVVSPLSASRGAIPHGPGKGKTTAGQLRTKDPLDASQRSALGVGASGKRRCAKGQRFIARKGVCVGQPSRRGRAQGRARGTR